MITYPRYLAGQSETQSLLIALGNAGINIMDRLIAQAGFPMESLAINTDQQSISNTLASNKISMGQMTTHGLGTGGDPEIGLDAVKESAGKSNGPLGEKYRFHLRRAWRRNGIRRRAARSRVGETKWRPRHCRGHITIFIRGPPPRPTSRHITP